MTIRKAKAVWDGNLKQGRGTISLGGNDVQLPYGFAARFEDGTGSNPEELIGGAHAGCFSMALAHELSEAGHPPTQIETTAHVQLEKSGDGFVIPKIELQTKAEVPGVDDETFQRFAQEAKENCPVSKALSATEITLSAELFRARGIVVRFVPVQIAFPEDPKEQSETGLDAGEAIGATGRPAGPSVCRTTNRIVVFAGTWVPRRGASEHRRSDRYIRHALCSSWSVL